MQQAKKVTKLAEYSDIFVLRVKVETLEKKQTSRCVSFLTNKK